MSNDYWQGPGGSTTSPTGGDFGTGSNWSTGSVPGSADQAVLSGGTTYIVTIANDGRNPSVAGLGVGSTVTVDILGDIAVTTVLFNQSEVIVDGQNSFGRIFLGGAVLAGGGNLVLENGNINDDVDSDVTTEIIENQDETISGDGYIFDATLQNDAGGIIDADHDASQGQAELDIETGYTVSNAGLMEATDDASDGKGALLQIDDSVTNTGTIAGYLHGKVQIGFPSNDDPTITGGNVAAHDAGTVVVSSGATLDGCTVSATDHAAIDIYGRVLNCTISVNETATLLLSGTTMTGGTVTVGAGATATLDGSGGNAIMQDADIAVSQGATLALVGTIANDDTITLAGTTGKSTLSFASDVQLQGGGQIILSEGGKNVVDATVAGATLDNLDNIIAGDGTLGSSRLILDNAGTIDATGTKPLTVRLDGTTSVNTGVMEATAGGALAFASGGLKSSGTVEVDANSTVIFAKTARILNNAGGVLTGGTWQVGAGGTLAITGGAVTTDKAAVTLTGAGSAFQSGDGTTETTIEQSLKTIAVGGSLDLEQRDYTTSNAISLSGNLTTSQGSTFTSGQIAASKASQLFTDGTIASSITEAGTVMMDGLASATFTGAADVFSGAFEGGGTVDLAGGSATLNAGLKLESHVLGISGAAVTLGAALTDQGDLSMTGGSLALSATKAYTLTVAGSAYLLGGSLAGSGTLVTSGFDTVSRFTIGGAAQLQDKGQATQTGAVTLGDSSNGAAKVTVALNAKWLIAGDVGITAGSTAAFINDLGALTKTTGTGTSVIGAGITHTGLGAGSVEVQTGTLELGGVLSGNLSMTIDVGTTLILDKAAASGAEAVFAGSSETLQLNAAQAYHGSIATFGGNDVLDLRSIHDSPAAPASLSYAQNSSAPMGLTSGTLTVSDGTRTANLLFFGNYTRNDFHLASDGHGGSAITFI